MTKAIVKESWTLFRVERSRVIFICLSLCVPVTPQPLTSAFLEGT